MNTDYVIDIKTKHGRTWSYVKKESSWTQTASTGIVRQRRGDQLLSHLLRPLAGDQPSLSVSVKRKRPRPRKGSPRRSASLLQRAKNHVHRQLAVSYRHDS